MAPYFAPHLQPHLPPEETPRLELFWWTVTMQGAHSSCKADCFSSSSMTDVCNYVSGHIRAMACNGGSHAERLHINVESHLHTPRALLGVLDGFASLKPICVEGAKAPPFTGDYALKAEEQKAGLPLGEAASSAEENSCSSEEPVPEPAEASHASSPSRRQVSGDTIVLHNSSSYEVSRQMVLATRLGLRLSRYSSLLVGLCGGSFVLTALSSTVWSKREKNGEHIILSAPGLWGAVLFGVAYWFLALHRLNRAMALHACQSFEVVAMILSVARAMAAYVCNDITLSSGVSNAPGLAGLVIQAFSYTAVLCTFDALRVANVGRKVLVTATFMIAAYFWLSHLINQPKAKGWQPEGAKIPLWFISVEPREHFIAGFGTLALVSGGAVWSLLVRGRDFAFLYDFLSVAPETRPSFLRAPTADVAGDVGILGGCFSFMRSYGGLTQRK